MKTIAKFITVSALLTITAACSSSGDMTKKVEAMQKKDKQLSCKEILLEMNEAEFYKGVAHENKGPKLKYMLMPLGYISTYMNAEEAINASNSRVSYLKKIYEISNCDGAQPARTNMASQQVPQNYYPSAAPQMGYQVQPRVMAPMHPQRAAMPVYQENYVATNYPNGYSAY